MTDEGQGSQQKPGPIDNWSIIDTDLYKEEASHSEGDFVPLKKGLHKDETVLVLDEAWHCLSQWYSGGPNIERKVVSADVTNRKLYVELYPLTLHGINSGSQGSTKSMTEFIASANTHHTWSFSRNTTLRMVRATFCTQWHLAPHKIGIYIGGSEEEHRVKDEDTKKTIDDFGLSDGMTIHFKTNPEAEIHTYKYNPYPSQPVVTWNREEHKLGTAAKGATGLHNLGNTCFMNAVLQCLSNTSPINKYMVEELFQLEINKENPLGSQGKLVTEFGKLLKLLWDGKYTHLVPRDFKKVLGTFATQFNGYQQQDSQELLAFLLDGIHEDLNRIKSSPTKAEETFTSEPAQEILKEKSDSEAAQESWENHIKRNSSLIVDLFHGLLKSKVVCGMCQKTSITFDPFMTLSLPIPSPSHRAIEVVYVPRLGQPRRYGVTVPKLSDISDLKESLGKFVGISKQELIVAENSRTGLYFLENWRHTHDTISKDQVVYAFQICPPVEQADSTTSKPAETWAKKAANAGNFGISESSGIFNLKLFQREIHTDGSRKGWSRSQIFGLPLILSFPIQTTYAALHDHIKEKIKSFFNWESEPQVNIRITNYDGHYCGICSQGNNCLGCELFNSDDVVDLRGKSLSIDWMPGQAKEYFTREENFILNDSSMEMLKEKKARRVSLKDCLELFSTEEKLSAENRWLCPNCKQRSEATIQLNLWNLPEILVIHLKRFQFTSVFRDKLMDMVDFPIELDMSEYVKNTTDDHRPYQLYAVTNHMGGLGGGHYTAFAKNFENGKWYSYNDSSCYEIDEKRIFTSDAYLLFYIRTPIKPSQHVEDLLRQKAEISQKTAEDIQVENSGNEHTDVTSDFQEINLKKEVYHPPDSPRPTNNVWKKPPLHNSPNYPRSSQRALFPDVVASNHRNFQMDEETYYNHDNDGFPELKSDYYPSNYEQAIVAVSEPFTPPDYSPPHNRKRRGQGGNNGFQKECPYCFRGVFCMDASDLEVHMLTECPVKFDN
eukprot:TRINITY_DN7289_c0_g1_i3.p1 TRINITY_DN7289_c0_g1~~TRINITY_DN7289_c0_g1_i3.p1  ORF type:complete len:1084 (-),score=332.05 TRINITY_DN7289_c0_g1_i3:3-3011(-)